MLAARELPDFDALTYPLWASPKLDGIRALVKKGKVLSRKLEVFPNKAAQEFAHLEGLDGEFIVGSPTDEQVRNITSGMMNRKQDEAPGLKFYVFDVWDSKEPFETRLDELEDLAQGEDNVVVVPYVLVNNKEELFALESLYLKQGYEGLILRSRSGKYKFGRSTLKEQGMLKVKRFLDAEAEVLEVHEEMKNTNKAEKDKLGRTKRSKAKAGLIGKGRAGELLVRGLNGQFKGVDFIVPLGGAGDEGKAWWWLHRRDVNLPVITYKYFPKGVKDKPLLPTYVGIREDWDR